MNTIELHQLLPEVFQDRPKADFTSSDIWLKDLRLERGKTYLLEAASGTGKTSLCSFLYGRRQDYQGQLLLDMQERTEAQDAHTLTDKDWDELRRSHLGQLYQEMRLFAELTVMENLEMKNRLTHFKSTKELQQMLEALGVADKQDWKAGKLSIGQQQRVALIRSLCQPLDFLLLDEPVSHLDEANSHRMATLVEQETRKQGCAVLVTSIGKTLPITYNLKLNI